MSAFLVSKAHIDYIVAGAITLGIIEDFEARPTGRMLQSENLKSLRARYPSNEHKAKAYVYNPPDKLVEPVQVIKAVHCLDYQSCEHDEWKSTKAKALLDKIEAAAIATLDPKLREEAIDRYGQLRPRVFSTPAYDQAEWAI
jgi:hypothetical protein